jgi:hypothetical protein
MRTAGDVFIAGPKTAADWKAFRKTLVPGNDPESWQKAFADYFHTRLSLRYLKPISVLQENGTFQGEGFSIVAIQCTLIEFLESTVEGRSYRYCRRGDPPLGPYEYSDSSDLFVRFLTERTPFKEDFDADLAREFYKNVRCGLLHEARTKGGWTIWAKSPIGKIVSAADKIVYRDDFHCALLQFVEWHRGALVGDASLQEAFIRKFDSLCA